MLWLSLCIIACAWGSNAPAGAPSSNVWFAYVDAKTDLPYYHNPLTEETTWTKPEGAAVKIVAQHSGQPAGASGGDGAEGADEIESRQSRLHLPVVVFG